MIAILKHGTTPEQTGHLVEWLKKMNLDVHISQGKEVTILGLVGDTSRVDMELLNSLEIVEAVSGSPSRSSRPTASSIPGIRWWRRGAPRSAAATSA